MTGTWRRPPGTGRLPFDDGRDAALAGQFPQEYVGSEDQRYAWLAGFQSVRVVSEDPEVEVSTEGEVDRYYCRICGHSVNTTGTFVHICTREEEPCRVTW